MMSTLIPDSERERLEQIASTLRARAREALRGEDDQQHRMTKAILECLIEDREVSGFDLDRRLPDVAGMEYTRAQQLLLESGVDDVRLVDLSVARGFFNALLTTKTVHGMLPSAGTPIEPGLVVALAFAQENERLRSGTLSSALREALLTTSPHQVRR